MKTRAREAIQVLAVMGFGLLMLLSLLTLKGVLLSADLTKLQETLILMPYFVSAMSGIIALLTGKI